MKWTSAEQSIWECINAGLAGLKRLDWLTLQEYEKIMNKLQEFINEKEK
jgi:hypothetical protein